MPATTSFLGLPLHIISESLNLPVLLILIIIFAITVILVGDFINEFSKRKKPSAKQINQLIYQISQTKNSTETTNIINQSQLPTTQKKILNTINQTHQIPPKSRESIARKLIEEREEYFQKTLERTDIITRIGPTLGLMGTLIPMGPGLAALGTGDITTLSSAIIVAFDTTVVGIGSGAIAYILSKIRRRWYEDYLSNIDVLSDALLEKIGGKNG